MKYILLVMIILVSACVNLNAYNYGTFEGNQKGCEEGHAKACNDLAGMYLTGKSKYKLRQDETKAKVFYDRSIKLYKKYCNEGDSKACFDLGNIYNGMRWGIDQNYTMMMHYYTKSCEYGNGFACNELGAAYKRGRGINKDKAKSKKYYDKALVLYEEECENNIAKSCANLGMIYLVEMYGTNDDESKSTKYLKKAFDLYEADCHHNNAEGCYQIGLSYLLGKSVINIVKDRGLAKKFFDKSCKLGESSACLKAEDIANKLNVY